MKSKEFGPSLYCMYLILLAIPVYAVEVRQQNTTYAIANAGNRNHLEGQLTYSQRANEISIYSVQKILQTIIRASREKTCSLERIHHLIESCDTNATTEHSSVNERSRCLLREDTDGRTTELICLNGLFYKTHSGTDIGHVIHKRFFLLIGLVVGLIVCAILCNKEIKAPKINTCPPPGLSSSYEATRGTRTGTATWNDPDFEVYDGSKQQAKTSYNGQQNEYHEGVNYVVFNVTDKGGRYSMCVFNFEIKVTRCTPPIPLTNGYIECDPIGFIYGASCRYSCSPGYILRGSQTTMCDRSGTWTNNGPVCEPVQCQPPPPIVGGAYECFDQSSYSYPTSCYPKCIQGYTLVEGFVIQCNTAGQWTIDRQAVCKDKEPPMITCPGMQTFYADKGQKSTLVTWPLPTATDSSNENITITQVDGPLLNTTISVGIYSSRYKATDPSGNESPLCLVNIEVKEIQCATPESQFQDKYIIFSCPFGYSWGGVCEIRCQFNYPINGSKFIICETTPNSTDHGIGKWESLNDTDPQCVVITCPELLPPKNGAIACHDSLNNRPFCQMSCMKGYDVETKFSGIFFCSDSGNWIPTSTVPDCIRTRWPQIMQLPSKLFYFTNTCNISLDEIKSNFLNATRQTEQAYNITICNPETGCKADDVTVTCGEVTGRRRRFAIPSFRHSKRISVRINMGSDWDNIEEGDVEYDTLRERRAIENAVTVAFSIVVPWNRGNTSYNDALYQHEEIAKSVASKIETAILAGKYNLPGLELREGSLQYNEFGELAGCKEGFLNQVTGTCEVCSSGKYYNISTTGCEPCRIGFYQENETVRDCTPCPAGTSTSITGAKIAADCKDICTSGSYSFSGIAPCAQCPRGFYQRENGSRSCLRCPSGTTTLFSGSRFEIDCQEFDVHFGWNTEPVVLAEMAKEPENYTLSFWLKMDNNQAFSIIINQTRNPSVSLRIHKDVTVDIENKTVTTGTQLSYNKWNYIHVHLDTAYGVATFGIGNKSVVQIKVPSLSNNSVVEERTEVFIESDEGVQLSGFIFSPFRGPPRSWPMSSCLESFDRVFIDMSIFLGLAAELSVNIPGSCKALDHCIDNPCGNHTCNSTTNGFECTCTNGYSGIRCEVAPDYCRNHSCSEWSSCKSGDDTYTCQCLPGYKGSLCDIPPIDGNWGTWEDWSACTTSCGVGSRLRIRRCDNPFPGDFGRDCEGNSNETSPCNQNPCPTCPELKEPNNANWTCTQKGTDGEITCTLSCRPGLVFLGLGVDQLEYLCGLSTHYIWSSNITGGIDSLPSCSEVEKPSKIETITSVKYPRFPCDDPERGKAAVMENMDTLQCVKNGTCEVNIKVSGCDLHVTDLAQPVTVDIKISTALSKNDLELEQFYSSRIVSKGLSEYITAFSEMETTAQILANNTDTLLTMVVDGVSYSVDSNSSQTIGSLECTEGYVAENGICVSCPMGTRYSNNSKCIPCEKGSFQVLPAKLNCTVCASGLTTVGRGSTNATDCVPCSAGQYGQSGLCYPCPAGFFQMHEGMESCIKCPEGTSTLSTGSMNCTVSTVSSTTNVLETPSVQTTDTTLDIVTTAVNTASSEAYADSTTAERTSSSIHISSASNINTRVPITTSEPSTVTEHRTTNPSESSTISSIPKSTKASTEPSTSSRVTSESNLLTAFTLTTKDTYLKEPYTSNVSTITEESSTVYLSTPISTPSTSITLMTIQTSSEVLDFINQSTNPTTTTSTKMSPELNSGYSTSSSRIADELSRISTIPTSAPRIKQSSPSSTTSKSTTLVKYFTVPESTPVNNEIHTLSTATSTNSHEYSMSRGTSTFLSAITSKKFTLTTETESTDGSTTPSTINMSTMLHESTKGYRSNPNAVSLTLQSSTTSKFTKAVTRPTTTTVGASTLSENGSKISAVASTTNEIAIPSTASYASTSIHSNPSSVAISTVSSTTNVLETPSVQTTDTTLDIVTTAVNTASSEAYADSTTAERTSSSIHISSASNINTRVPITTSEPSTVTEHRTTNPSESSTISSIPKSTKASTEPSTSSRVTSESNLLTAFTLTTKDTYLKEPYTSNVSTITEESSTVYLSTPISTPSTSITLMTIQTSSEVLDFINQSTNPTTTTSTKMSPELNSGYSTSSSRIADELSRISTIPTSAPRIKQSSPSSTTSKSTTLVKYFTVPESTPVNNEIHTLSTATSTNSHEYSMSRGTSTFLSAITSKKFTLTTETESTDGSTAPSTISMSTMLHESTKGYRSNPNAVSLTLQSSTTSKFTKAVTRSTTTTVGASTLSENGSKISAVASTTNEIAIPSTASYASTSIHSNPSSVANVGSIDSSTTPTTRTTISVMKATYTTKEAITASARTEKTPTLTTTVQNDSNSRNEFQRDDNTVRNVALVGGLAGGGLLLLGIVMFIFVRIRMISSKTHKRRPQPRSSQSLSTITSSQMNEYNGDIWNKDPSGMLWRPLYLDGEECGMVWRGSYDLVNESISNPKSTSY